MSVQSTGLQDWFQTPQGRYLLDWERAQLDRVVADIFGYHALQLGTPALDALRANRMPHRWHARDGAAAEEPAPNPGFARPPEGVRSFVGRSGERLAGGGTSTGGAEVTTGAAQGQRSALSAARPELVCDFAALPFPANSLDLIVLPHTLEWHVDPHATLREVERVLMPEGRVVICGLNPASLWGLRQRRARLYRSLGFGEYFLPPESEFIGYWRLRDWLHLLSFEVESGRFGCYRPSARSELWLDRFQWMDRVGSRWWPIFGAVYFLVAVKRVRGMRLLGPAWRSAPSRAKVPVQVANRKRAPQRDAQPVALEMD